MAAVHSTVHLLAVLTAPRFLWCKRGRPLAVLLELEVMSRIILSTLPCADCELMMDLYQKGYEVGGLT